MMMTIADVIKQLVEAHEDGKDINLNKYVFTCKDIQLLGICLNNLHTTASHYSYMQCLWMETDVLIVYLSSLCFINIQMIQKMLSYVSSVLFILLPLLCFQSKDKDFS